MTMRARMSAGMLYRVDDEMLPHLRRARRLTRLFNASAEDEVERRREIIRELFGSVGENINIEPTFRCDYGKNISIGDNFYANFDCVILDVCPVTIGDNVMLGPRVGVYTALHPMDAAVRASLVEYGKPIDIGNDVWIGGNAVLNGGVSVGAGSVVGSGSVVTRPIPPGVFAAGNPCRVIREITAADKELWEAKLAEFNRDTAGG